MIEDASTPAEAAAPLTRNDGPLGDLPFLTRRQVQLDRRLGKDGSRIATGLISHSLGQILGEAMTFSRFSMEWRAAGLRRPGAIAQLSCPRLSTKIGLGIEPTLAHVLVDRLLGFERLPAEGRLQVTPVEWGILSFLMARCLYRLDQTPGPFRDWELTLDRLGPDPFDTVNLGPIVTWRWRVTVGDTLSAVRLWVPESLLALWLLDDPAVPTAEKVSIGTFGDLSSFWNVECGSVRVDRGLISLVPGALLLIEGAPLSGTPLKPEGLITLVQSDHTGRSTFLARAEAGRLVVVSTLKRAASLRETHTMANPAEFVAKPNGNPAPVEIPVTLTVELGRINLPLRRLAELQPGDVLELGRHAREPVDLTSGGKLVARGELVQVDTELGVRLTHVFL